MTCRTTLPKTLLLAGVLVGCAAALACGGGGGGGGVVVPPGLTAAFDGSNDNPTGQTLSMQQGTASGDTFSVQVLVTDINAFFGAGFRVTYNASSVTYTGVSSANSFIDTGGVTTIFQVQQLSPGTLIVTATRQGSSVAGVNSGQEALLVTLNFRATAATSGNTFGFGTAATRQVTVCPTAGQQCTNPADGTITWSGGTLVAN